jgi:uncharacterized protein YndB with AHSA1/START domain
MHKESTMSYSQPTKLPRPDLSGRPHQLIVEHDMNVSPATVYAAWTENFDSWFAGPGLIRMRAQEDEPFYFETEHDGGRHSHYGRFLTLKRDELVELTWMTGIPGTGGAETILTVELTPTDTGTHVCLTHAGFHDQVGVQQHEAWCALLPRLEERLAAKNWQAPCHAILGIQAEDRRP